MSCDQLTTAYLGIECIILVSCSFECRLDTTFNKEIGTFNIVFIGRFAIGSGLERRKLLTYIELETTSDAY